MVDTENPSPWEVKEERSGVQCHSLHSELEASLDYTRPYFKRLMPTQTTDVLSWLLFIFVIIRNSGVFRWLTFLGKLHGGEPGEVVYAWNNGIQKAEARTVSTDFISCLSDLHFMCRCGYVLGHMDVWFLQSRQLRELMFSCQSPWPCWQMVISQGPRCMPIILALRRWKRNSGSSRNITS